MYQNDSQYQPNNRVRRNNLGANQYNNQPAPQQSAPQYYNQSPQYQQQQPAPQYYNQSPQYQQQQYSQQQTPQPKLDQVSTSNNREDSKFANNNNTINQTINLSAPAPTYKIAPPPPKDLTELAIASIADRKKEEPYKRPGAAIGFSIGISSTVLDNAYVVKSSDNYDSFESIFKDLLYNYDLEYNSMTQQQKEIFKQLSKMINENNQILNSISNYISTIKSTQDIIAFKAMIDVKAKLFSSESWDLDIVTGLGMKIENLVLNLNFPGLSELKTNLEKYIPKDVIDILNDNQLLILDTNPKFGNTLVGLGLRLGLSTGFNISDRVKLSLSGGAEMYYMNYNADLTNFETQDNKLKITKSTKPKVFANENKFEITPYGKLEIEMFLSNPIDTSHSSFFIGVTLGAIPAREYHVINCPLKLFKFDMKPTIGAEFGLNLYF